MNPQKQKKLARIRRHKRVHARIVGASTLPRLSVFRSLRAMYIQLIDDKKGHTLAAVRVPLKDARKGGAIIAQKAKERHIARAVFDRGGYAYHGHVKEVAESARENGLVL